MYYGLQMRRVCIIYLRRENDCVFIRTCDWWLQIETPKRTYISRLWCCVVKWSESDRRKRRQQSHTDAMEMDEKKMHNVSTRRGENKTALCVHLYAVIRIQYTHLMPLGIESNGNDEKKNNNYTNWHSGIPSASSIDVIWDLLWMIRFRAHWRFSISFTFAFRLLSFWVLLRVGALIEAVLDISTQKPFAVDSTVVNSIRKTYSAQHSYWKRCWPMHFYNEFRNLNKESPFQSKKKGTNYGKAHNPKKDKQKKNHTKQTMTTDVLQ